MISINNLLLSACLGCIGGAARASLGVLKSKAFSHGKNKTISMHKIFLNLASSCLIGVFCGLLFSSGYRFSLLAGYAGIDLAEGLSKIIKEKFDVHTLQSRM